MSSAIQALAFDAYGTLFDVHSVVSTCNELFPHQGLPLSQLWRTKQLEYTWLLSLMGRYQDFWQVTESALIYACRSLNLPCPRETRQKLMDAYLRLDPYPEVPPALRSLSKYKLAILSNGSPRMLKAVVENSGLKSMFADVISVDEVKVYKPSPRVYELASRRLKVPQDAIGFISSNFWDIAGAKSFGLWTCWIDRFKAPEEELGFRPDAMIGSLGELEDVIGPTTKSKI
ncbi:MAG TPA: haloacid dehalogenase type II [Terriglobales bacterium]|nr:haloacid dehalogenase type II [Terriglobales bacterium]